MRDVADKLKEWAIQQKDDNKADVFGRSAFNRYYYAVFLKTRKVIKRIHPDIGDIKHKEIPDIMRGKHISGKVENRIQHAKNKKRIDPEKFLYYKDTLKISVETLSKLHTNAYDIRVKADYFPEVPIIRENNSITLNGQTLDEASKWPDQAVMIAGKILEIWGDEDLDPS
ncbi:MAG: hypothetical protein HQK96_16500 [Nitrospirae bacterium]|nr:hypothetical protein [Nitrospirota bacterium]